VRAVYVLKKLPDISEPGLIKAGHYMAHMSLRTPTATLLLASM
jgi:hypothetical protein